MSVIALSSGCEDVVLSLGWCGSSHIDALAKKYLGKDRYPWKRPDEERLIVEIEPTSVQGMG